MRPNPISVRGPPYDKLSALDKPPSTHDLERGSRTYNYAASSDLRAQKAPKDGLRPCFTPKSRCYLSKSLGGATVRLSRSWEDLYHQRPLFTLFYRYHPHKKLETAPPGASVCRGGLSLSWGCSSSLWTANAKSVSERIWQRSHDMRPNPGTISRMLISQVISLQYVARHFCRDNA